MIESVDPMWGGARMYGSPVVREDGYISEGRLVEGRKEIVINEPTALNGRLGRGRGPAFGYRLEDEVENRVEDQVETIVGGPISVVDESTKEPITKSPPATSSTIVESSKSIDSLSETSSIPAPPLLIQDDTLYL